MLRLPYNELLKWKKNPKHPPILLRGARQVGKTYLVEQFGNKEFSSFININFEFTPSFSTCFDNLDPAFITNSISAITRQPIIPGQTLLFLDEIQLCPEAIMSLRYFKEKMPELHVIAAGSLLEFTISDDRFQMPVGRVRSMFMRPVSFYEYLIANNYTQLIDTLSNSDFETVVPIPIHEQLIKLLREYFVLGGMPEVIADYQDNQDLLQAQTTQSSILTTYRGDFGKYASKTQHKYLQKIFERAPTLVGEQFQYSKIDSDVRARELKQPLDMLCKADLIHRVYHTSASGLPLMSGVNDSRFKTIFVDIGLVQASTLIDPTILLREDLLLVNRGALAEQFVGQELLAYFPSYLPGQLFYWQREKKGAMAEVDYVINIDSQIIPIEVKAGKTGSLRSIHVFLKEKSMPLGVRLSLKPLSIKNNIASIPLYMIYELPRLLKKIG